MGLAGSGLSGCTSSRTDEADSDHGWLSGYQVDKDNDGSCSREEVDEGFSAADADGDSRL
jgi:hypothetical protein